MVSRAIQFCLNVGSSAIGEYIRFADGTAHDVEIIDIAKKCFTSIDNKTRRTIRPTHPEEMLREDFMVDLGLTAATLSKALGVSRQTINELLHEHRALAPAMALRLGKLFGNTHQFWLNAQRSVDLWNAEQRYDHWIERIKPLDPA